MELRGIEGNLKNLANTSINGQYLFSGSAVDIRPIDDDGIYHGNDVSMNAFLGSRTEQQYNISGAELFLGEDSKVKRTITSNVVQSLNAPASNTSGLTTSTTMSEFMGDSPSDNHYFYLRGTQSDGTAFSKKITLQNDSKVSSLLNDIGKAYGNTGLVDVVNVTLNGTGQIVIEDKMRGSSKLDFHLVGATDFNPDATDAADVNNIDLLKLGLADYATASNSSDPKLYLKEFVKSGFTSATGISGAEGLIYDRTEFSVKGSTISSNMTQVLKNSHIVNDGGFNVDTIAINEKNSFAQASTLLSEVADISKGTSLTSDDTLDGTKLMLSGKDIGGNTYDIQIALNSGGSTFSYDSNNNGVYDDPSYDIFDMTSNPRAAVDADKMTYQQLMDVMNMVVTNNIPAANDEGSYDTAVKASTYNGITSLSYDGKIEFKDLTAGITKASIAMYDNNSGDFSADTGSVISFNSNNALTVRDAKTDFFKTINQMIESVENYINSPDSSVGDGRVVGINNSIAMMDDLQDHIFSSHSQIGANSNALTASLERTSTLEISTRTLRSSVIDTDLAEASLTLTQLTLNYEAMLSTVGRVSKLSLVNYL